METARRSILPPVLSLIVLFSLFIHAPTLSADEKATQYSFKPAGPEDEKLIFTPLGFDQVGDPAIAEKENSATLNLVVNDSKTGQPTFCRINVVGPDGQYYEPAQNYLTQFSLTGVWPNWPKGWGNRPGKAPIRYLGRYFYSWGKASVKVPPGTNRIEIWKGFEFRPVTHSVNLQKDETVTVTLNLDHEIPMPELGYHSGDPHIHIDRNNPEEAERILDLMEAEDIHYGSILAYNDPAGPYHGFLNKMVAPQMQGIGPKSVLDRETYSILSGQEYRSASYGHLNLFFDDDIVLKGKDINADNWPPYGHVSRETRKKGGFAFYAHGGYAQEIYADFVQDNIDGVELLQFGVYRGIGLDDWYHILNCGYRFPMIGASDYPACRKLGDCKTYIHSNEKRPDFKQWLNACSKGESFVTTGPMTLLTVNGQKPGHLFYPEKPETFNIQLKVKSVVSPVTHLQIIANGKIIAEKTVADQKEIQSDWIELSKEIKLSQSTWIAARAFSFAPTGTPDSESHTNPVYIYFDDKAPYNQDSLDVILEKLDGQMDRHRKRKFQEKAKILDYFQKSRDILLDIRAQKGLSANAKPNLNVSTDFDASATEISEAELKKILKPVPPKEPEEALKTFETSSGFSMQIVAAEPLVHDPIAACFDEKGNLYVTEMLDYPYYPKEGEKPIGTVRLLRDTNKDGTYDKSTIFAEELLWAGGVVPWKGGLYIAAPPNIWYMKDTNGDDKADIKRKVFTGFGSGNQQAMLNNLKFGLDHKIYGSTAGNGGKIITVAHPDQPPIDINGRDFRFDPVTEKLETITGTVQFGNTFDDWGNRFLCSQGIPARHELLPQRYLERNPNLIVSGPLHTVAPAGIRIYRTSPIETWRQIRVARRRTKNPAAAGKTGSTHHVIDASAGTTVYRGNAYPSEYYGNLFIGCGQNNLVHQRKLIPDGLSFRTERIENRTEFIRSTDIWFRPVNFVNAPDGTLYCLDMAREFLESIHIPLDVVKHLDLTSGRNRGRIYRMAPPDFQFPGNPNPESFQSDQLLKHLQNKNGWWRDTAHRIIYEKQDASLVPGLKQMATEDPFPQARLHALWSLQGLNALDDSILLKALEDPHPRIREHAIRLSEPYLQNNENLLSKIITFTEDPDDRIRFQLAFSLGESTQPLARKALASLAKKESANPNMRTAILSSASQSTDQLFELLWKDKAFSKTSTSLDLFKQLMQVICSGKDQKEISHTLDLLASQNQGKELSLSLYNSLASALVSSGLRPAEIKHLSSQSNRFLEEIFKQASQSARNKTLKTKARSTALQQLATFPLNQTEDLLVSLLDDRDESALHLQVISALGSYSHPDSSEILLARWDSFTPPMRSEAIKSFLANKSSTFAFLKAAQENKVSISSLNQTEQTILLSHRDPEIVSLADKLLAQLKNTPRKEVVEQYQTALTLKGNLTSGEKVFTQTCSICHKVGNIGKEIGPNLMTTLSQDSSMLITHIMDPNRYVPPDFIQYIVIDVNGKTYSGMITEQSATSITLTENKEKSHTLLLNQVDEMKSTGKSLMPEGLEKNVSPQQMADLIAFLKENKKQLDQMAEIQLKAKQKEIGTEPGLINPE